MRPRLHFALGAYVAIATKPAHRLQICPIMHNYTFSYHSPKLHPGTYSSMGMQRGTDRHTDRQTAVITIHFAWLCLMRNVAMEVLYCRFVLAETDSCSPTWSTNCVQPRLICSSVQIDVGLFGFIWKAGGSRRSISMDGPAVSSLHRYYYHHYQQQQQHLSLIHI